MSRMIPNENSWVGWSLVAPADPAAPTEDELAAALTLTPWIVSINPTSQGNAIPAPALDSLFDRSAIGTSQGSFSGDFYRDDDNDLAWETIPRGEDGYLYVSRFGGTGTDKRPVAGQKVETWHLGITQRAGSNMTSNTLQTFSSTAAVLDPPEEDAVVAAGTGVPSAPRVLVATQGATGVVALDWDVPASDGGAAITNYKIYKSTTSAVAGWAEVTTGLAPAHPSTATTTVVSSLGTVATWFRVTAINGSGESAPSNVVTLTVT